MRNIETLTTKTGPDDAWLNILLTEARLKNAGQGLKQWQLALIAWRVISHPAS